jgi:hypothetical protein
MTTSLKRSKGSQSSLRIGTYSFWIKLTQVGAFNVYSNTDESDNNRGYFQLTSDNKWRMVDNDASGTHIQLRTNRLFRDFNAWYHFVIRVDTTQSSSTDRVRLYVNGVQETSFDQTDYPAQNDDLKIFSGGQTNREFINNIYGGSASSPNFYLSHFHYADGQSYAPSTFGSTDSTTGEWKINTSPSVTYGNQGFFMFKDDASLNDDSGNGNNWTADSGTIQKSEDNPSNVFAMWNSLMIPGNMQYQNGNTSIRPQANSVDFQAASTLAFKTGKFYAEFKYLENDGHQLYGISTTDGAAELLRNGQYPGQTTTSVAIYASNGSVYENNSATSYGSGFANNAIIMMAVDADNNKIYFGSNGSWYNSGNPSSGTNGYSFNATNLAGFKYMVSGNGASGYDNVDANFGNGYFGTTAVSSAGSNASGIGIFEYDVPSGYTALSTKGLNL